MKLYLIILTLLTFTHLLSADWQTCDGVTVWTKYPNSQRRFSWDGGKDSSGVASGYGIYRVYFDGQKVAAYTGNMKKGRMEGKVSAIYYKTSQKYEGEMKDWDENGIGTMTYADGASKSGRWKDGELVEETPALAPVSGTQDSTPVPQNLASVEVSGDCVELGGMLPPPGTGASVTERFLYELSVLTRTYALEMAYQAPVGNGGYTDCYWLSPRTRGVVNLLNDRAYAQIPDSLRSFMRESLTLDAMLLLTAAGYDKASVQGQEDLFEMLDDVVKMPDFFSRDAGDIMFKNVFVEILRIKLRMERLSAMFRDCVTAKQNANGHRRWATLLNQLATDDPGVVKFARDPRTSDPTWHFNRSRKLDIFMGQSITTRAKDAQSPAFKYPGLVRLGSLGNGALQLNINSNRAIVCRLLFNVPNGARPIFKMVCSRGHFGILTGGGESAWTARGLADGSKQGHLDFSKLKYYFNGPDSPTFLFHLPTFGGPEDKEAKGYLLIYLAGQYDSDEAAVSAARQIDL